MSAVEAHVAMKTQVELILAFRLHSHTLVPLNAENLL